jgi:hypothetical protein
MTGPTNGQVTNSSDPKPGGQDPVTAPNGPDNPATTDPPITNSEPLARY